MRSTVRHGEQGGVLEHDPRWRSGPRTAIPSTTTLPAVGATNPANTCSSVDFPHPDGPSTATSDPGRDVEVDPVDGDDLVAPVAEHLDDAAGGDHRAPRRRHDLGHRHDHGASSSGITWSSTCSAVGSAPRSWKKSHSDCNAWRLSTPWLGRT